MTRFAKPLLLETPCCKNKVMRRRFASINSFGLSTRWSDGYSSTLFGSNAPHLAYCDACNKVYWLEDATELGVVTSLDQQPEYRSSWMARIFSKKTDVGSVAKQAEVGLRGLDFVDYHEHPRPADLLLAMLREEWTTPERELYLRSWLWWIGNHRQRGQLTASPMSGIQAEQNMLRLLALHQAAPAALHQIRAVGELLRQMGRFDEATSALEVAAENDTDTSAILEAARRGETDVFLLETY